MPGHVPGFAKWGRAEYLTVPPFSQTMPPKLPPCIPGTWHTLPDAIARHKAGFQREKEKGRKVLNLIGLGSGARSRTRTGTSFETRF